jgi:beta-glucanase (GH16 family)
MKPVLLVTSLLAALFSHIASSAPPSGDWILAFEDDFDSRVLDSEKWNVRSGPRRDAYWDGAGVIPHSNGLLEISTRVVNGKVVSGSIDTKTRFEQRFGYFEARCRLPKMPGHWSAFWLLSREFGSSDSARRSGAEVDIFEYHALLGNTVHHAVHWPKYGPSLQSRKKRTPLVYDGQFHVFGLLWDKNKYVFFVDGAPVWETAEGVSEAAHYILLTNEVGPWAGKLDVTALPDGMTCDYVRVYKHV